MAVGGRVLGEAFVVISPDVSDFLAELTTKVKVAVSSMPQQNVKVGLDASPVNAGIAALRTQLGTALAKAAELKITGDDGPLTKMMAGIAARGAALQKQLGNLVMAADTTKLDAAIAKETTKLTGLRQLLQRLEMGADTTRIDKAIAKEEAAVTKLKQQMSDLQLNADDKELAYKIERDIELVESLQARIASKTELGADTAALRAQLAFVEARLAVLQEEGKIRLRADVTALLAGIAVAQDKISRLRAEAESARLMNPKQIAETQAQIAATTAEITRLNAEAAKAKLAGLDPVVMAKIAQGVAGVTADVNAMHDAFRKMADTGPLLGPVTAQMARLQAQSGTITKALDDIHISGDDAGMKAQLAGLQLQSEKLRAALHDMPVDADPVQMAKMEAEVARLTADTGKLYAAFRKLADTGPLLGPVTAQMAKLHAQSEAITKTLGNIKISGDNAAMTARLEALRFQAARLRAALADMPVSADPVQVAKMSAALAALDARTVQLGKDVTTLNAPVAKAGTGLFALVTPAAGLGTWFNVLNTRIPLFGGALNRLVPAFASGVTVWHLAADAILEIGAVAIPATIALGAFGYAGADAAKEIQNRMQAAHTVMDATGKSIPGLTTGFEQLHDAVRPQVYQLFGDAMIALHSRTGEFSDVAKATGTVVDQLGARLTYAMTSGTGMSVFMRNAVPDAKLLGDAIGNIGGIIGDVLKVLPGFAEHLLAIFDVFTKVAEAVTTAAEPLIHWVLLIHGWILYAGLAVTAGLAFIGMLAKMGAALVTFAAEQVMAGVGALVTFGSAIVTAGLAVAGYVEEIIAADGATATFEAVMAPLLAMSPVGWFLLAAAAIAGLVYAFHNSGSAADDFAKSMNNAVQSAQITNVIPAIMSAQASAAKEVTAAQDKLNRIQEYSATVNLHTGEAVQRVNPLYSRQAQQVDILRRAQADMNTQYQLVSGRVGDLAKQYGGNTQALGALNAAGITTAQITDKNSEHWAQALIQVKATTQAYKDMGVQGGTLGNDLDVLGRTVTSQYQAVQKLNQAWSSFISDVTGTQTTFDTVAQGFDTLANYTGAVHLRLGHLQTSFASTKASIDSLTPSGVALNQAFADQVGNIEKMTASWRTAGLSQQEFKSGVAAAIAPMEQYAAGSQEATAQLVALAQMAGYQGPENLDQLNKYLGISQGMLSNTAGDTEQLKSAANDATVQEALLTGALQAQGDYIASQLIGDINQAILAYEGVGPAATAWGKAIAQFGRDSPQAQAAQDKLTTAIIKSGLAAGDSAPQIAAMLAKVTGITVPQAMKDIAGYELNAGKTAQNAGPLVYALGLDVKALGDKSGITKQATQNLAQTLLNQTGNVKTAKGEFEQLAAQQGINKDEADKLWNAYAANLTPAVKDSGDKASKAKTDFENFAVHGLHLTTGKADELWQKMKGPLGSVLDDLAKSKAPGAKKAFEDLAGDPKKGLGLSKKQADDLWTSLHGNLGKELSTLGGPGGDVMKSKAAFEAWAGQGGKSGLSLAKWQADQLYTALTGKGGLQSGIDSLHGKTVKITVDTSQADKAIAGIQQRLGTDIGGGTLGPTGRAGIGKQRGGLITTGTGPTADDVQVLASRGEYVVRAASVSQYGTGLLDALNAGIVPPGSRLVHPMDLSQGTAGLAHALAQRPALHPAAVPTANVPHAVTAAPPRGFAAGFAAGGLIGYAAGGPVTAAPAGGGGGGGGGTISLAGMIAQLSGQLQALFTQRIPAWLNSFADQGKTTFTKLANSLQTILASVLNAMFTTKMPVWLTGTENSFRKLWTMAAGDFHNALVIPVQAFFTSSVPTWLTSTGNGNRTTWATAGNDFRNGLVTPVQQFFTSTVPGDFNALDTKARQTFDDVNAYFSGHVNKPIATAISAWSGDISNAFKSGWNATAQQFNSSVVNWINANILKNLPGSLSIQPIPGFAGGGHIPGSGNADSHLALLTPGEYVVRKGAVSALERRQPGVMDLINSADTLPRLQSGGPGYQMAGGGLIPAYATGGSVYQNPLRAISGLVGERIDMGVDFAGTGSLYAIGPGTITSIMNSGWPPYPGAFIDEVFSAGPASGRHFYFAEDIRPSVSIGQQVDSNTVIGQMYAGKEGIEAGWASGVGGQTLAAYFHQQAGAGDPGSVSTAYGASANAFLVSLGAPGGRLQGGGVRGTVAGGFPSPGGYGAGGAAVAVMWQVLEGLLDPTGTKLSTATAKLSPYVQGGAPELLKLANQGAQAIFDAIWKNAVVPRLSTLPASTIPGGYAHLTAALLDKGISGYMKAKDDAAKTSAAATGVPSVGQPGGTATPGLITVAQYVMAHGGTKEAGAGVAGTVAGESGGNPESVGSGGAGLIGWTPPSSAKPFFPIVTGNPGKDMAVQLVDMMYYIAGRGGIGLINAAGASGGPQAAAQAFSRMEAPAVPYSDIRPSIVDQLFKAGYDKGGVLRPGVTLAVNRTGHDETVLAMPPHRVAGIMRHAAGGLAGYQQKLSSDQAAELRDYAAFTAAARYSLAHAAPGSYVSRDRSSILGEMSTLAARQASEAAAYKPVTSANVTAAQIAHLITAINGMVTVTRDIALGHLPGGSLVTLRNLLTAMAKSAALEPSLPATPKPGASSLFWDWKAPSGTISLSDFWTQVISGEVTEKATYAAVASAFRKSLAAAKPGAWDYVHRAVLGSELQTLALRQNEEISAYNALVATKGTTGNRPGAAQLSRYLASLKSMATTVRDADLSHVPGGHPAEMTTMYADLGGLHQIAGQSIGDPTAPFPALFAPYTLPKRGTPAYATLASIFGWYDRGGILPPGLTLAYNATGRNEIVSPVPPGAVYGPGGMTPGEMQLVNRLDRLITLMSSAPAAYSQALSGVAGQAASRGIYGSR